jgi:hypothetical protein
MKSERKKSENPLPVTIIILGHGLKKSLFVSNQKIITKMIMNLYLTFELRKRTISYS